MRKYWDKRYKKEELIYGKRHSIALKYLLKYIGKKEKILEICGGYGRNAYFLAKKGYKIKCTEASRQAINIGKNIYKNPNLSLEVKNALKLDYFKGAYQAVVSIYGLNSLDRKNVEKIFRNISRIVKIGGKFCNIFLSTDDVEFATGKLIAKNTFVLKDGQLVKFFTLSEIEELHRKYGFKIEKCLKIKERRKIADKTITSRFFLVLSRKV